jgi:hypothetical protein
MCGFIGFSGNLDNKEAILQKMMDRIVHRGPDMGGMYKTTATRWGSGACPSWTCPTMRTAHGQRGQKRGRCIQRRDLQFMELRRSLRQSSTRSTWR